MKIVDDGVPVRLMGLAAALTLDRVANDRFEMTLGLSDSERAMLERLADVEGSSREEVIRRAIRAEFARRFEASAPTATTPTLRGILADICSPTHYRDVDLAERTGLSLDVIEAALKPLLRKKLLTKFRRASDTDGLTYESLVALGPLLEAAARINDLDDVLG